MEIQNDGFDLGAQRRQIDKNDLPKALELIKVDGLINGAAQTVKDVKENFDPAALFLVHCGGRKLGIGDRVDEDFVAIKNACGNVPFIVAFTFGEYGQMNHSGATICGLSLSFTGFSK